MAWKNGQGMTREIAREPGEGDFLWRLSIAEVAASGDFSLFPGYDRTITLIEGAGMRLAFEEAPEKAILKRFEPFDFSGDWHCRCTLAGGPVRDFNLMVDRECARGKTEALRLDGHPVERSVEFRLAPDLLRRGRALGRRLHGRGRRHDPPAIGIT